MTEKKEKTQVTDVGDNDREDSGGAADGSVPVTLTVRVISGRCTLPTLKPKR